MEVLLKSNPKLTGQNKDKKTPLDLGATPSIIQLLGQYTVEAEETNKKCKDIQQI